MAIVFTGYSMTALAQEEKYVTHPDTLRVDLAEGQSITFAFKNIIKSHFDSEFDSAYSASIDKIESILKLDSHMEPAFVKLVNRLVENELRDVVKIIPISQDNKEYMSINDGLQNRNEFSKVHFTANNIAVEVYLKKLKDLKTLCNLSLNQLDAKIKEKQKNISSPKKAYYINTKPEGNSFTDLNISDDGVTDFLTINTGIGAGLFRDKLAPEIAVNADITLGSKHGIKLHRFGLQSSFHYFFDRNIDKSYDMHVNTFVTAYYKYNFSKSSISDRWGGIGIGYLVKSRGDYFKGNTFKASIFISPDDSDISIVPEIIITNDFKSVFPSLRFGLTF
jgi:hypothetical protein